MKKNFMWIFFFLHNSKVWDRRQTWGSEHWQQLYHAAFHVLPDWCGIPLCIPLVNKQAAFGQRLMAQKDTERD